MVLSPHALKISPLLTFNASFWPCIKLIYVSLLFNMVLVSLIPAVIFFSLKCCLFLLQCTSFSGYLETLLKKIASLTVSNLPDLLPVFASFFSFLCLSEVHCSIP